jgi:iron complex outermembrane receptor protein
MFQTSRYRSAALAGLSAIALVPLAARAQEPAPAPQAPQAAPAEAPKSPAPQVLAPQAAPSLQSSDSSDINAVDLESMLNLPVVTSGGGRTEGRAMASANVELVTSDDISRRGYQSIGEVLSGALGIYTIDDQVMPSVGVRGISGGLRAGSRLVKVMINGTPVDYRPDLTAFLGPEFIPMEAVDHVEIAKGPLSALYGANAFIAVVNVITRTPTPGVTAGLTAGASAIRGHGGGAGSGLVGYSGEGHTLLGAFSTAQIDRSGLRMRQTFSTQNSAAPVMGAASQGDISRPQSLFVTYRNENATGGILTLQAGRQVLDTTGEFQLASVLTHRNEVVYDNFWSSGRYERRFNESLVATVTAGWSQGGPGTNHVRYLTGTNSFSFRPNDRYGAFNGAAEFDYAPAARFSVHVGVDGEYDSERILSWTKVFNAPQGLRQSGDSLDLLPPGVSRYQAITDVGAYVQLAAQPFAKLEKLHLTGNLRLDRITYGSLRVPTQTSWRGAAAYEWTSSFVTKIIAGQAFQTPSGVMMFAQPGLGTDYNVVGNLTIQDTTPLKPQRVTSVEAVASATLFGRVSLEGGAYYQLLQDQIEFTQLTTDFLAANRGDASNVGVEATARVTAGRVSAYARASLQRGLVGGLLAAHDSPEYPSAFGTAGADLDLPLGLRLNGQVRWASARGASQSNILLNNEIAYSLPAYATASFTLSSVGWHLLGGKPETRIGVSLRNAFDEHHFEPGYGGYDTPSMGRMWFAELKQSF